MGQVIKPLPNPEVYPLTPEAKFEIFLSEYYNKFKKEINAFLNRYRGEAVDRNFYTNLVQDLKFFLKSYFSRQEDLMIKADCYRAGDKIIVTISHKLDWEILYNITTEIYQ